jgi:membrane-associated phospholipid phosphatase
MTAANEINPETGDVAISPLRRCAANFAAAVRIFARPTRLHPRQPWPLTPQRLAIALALIVAVLLIGMFFIDAAAINVVGHLPRWVRSGFGDITGFGKSGWFLWPLGILFLAMVALPQTLSRVLQRVLAAAMVRVGFLFVAIGAPSLFVTIVKRMIGRARPLVTGIADPFAFGLFVWSPNYASMPSGHATTAFAALAAFGVLWPRARPILLIYALLIATSRVVVTAHYPTDVVAGALFGIVGVLMVRRYFALRLLGFSVAPDGSVRTFPGPSFNRIKSVARALFAY